MNSVGSLIAAVGFTSMIFSSSVLAEQCSTPAGFNAVTEQHKWEQPTAKDVSLVNLWAVWCPPCLKELKMLDAIANNEAYSIDTIHIGDNPDAIQSRFDELAIQHLPDTIEPDLAKLQEWGFHGIPATMVVINGEVRFRYNGYIKHDSNSLDAWLSCLSQGEEL